MQTYRCTVCGDLPLEEKNAFGEFVNALGRKEWITKDPCDDKSWSFAPTGFQNATIICNCLHPDGLYRIERIDFTGLVLPGVLSASLAKLPYLKHLNLGRNYLSGNILPEWASLKLEYLAINANRLSGPIPRFLETLTSLTALSLENNFFNGSIPPELGKLVNLQRLYLTANFLTGELPEEFLKLKNLTELRISSNNFTGKLPGFLGWRNLNQLEMQATGFEGPIPSSISALTNLTELVNCEKISDLKDGPSAFPQLDSMRRMQKLMLRSCNLIRLIPSYFQEMSNLVIMDLSFNMLDGGIPDPPHLAKLEILYLTGNHLSGRIPGWIISRDPKLSIDLSYNNISENSEPLPCQDSSLNLFRSYRRRSISERIKCLPPCSKDWYSFHVNCGGSTARIGSTTFDGDKAHANVCSSKGKAKLGNEYDWRLFWYRKDAIVTTSQITSLFFKRRIQSCIQLLAYLLYPSLIMGSA